MERPRAALAALLRHAPFLPGEAIGTWRAPSGRAAFAWAGTGVHAEAAAAALFSGRPIRWDGEEADGRGPLDPAGYLSDPQDWAPALDGRWAAAAYDEGSGELRVAADALGAHPLHTTEAPDGRWFGNAPLALRELGAGDRRPAAPGPLASLLGGGWSLAGDTWWPGVRRLGRSVLVRDRGEARAEETELLPLAELVRLPGAGSDPERAAALLVAALGALADWPGRESLVPVTGGRDSRVVLAGALRAGFPFTGVTGGVPGSGDVETGRALCVAAGVPHRLLGARAGGDVWSDPDGAARVIAALSGGTASLADAAGFPLARGGEPAPLWHSGQGGEIGRAYYGRAGEGESAPALADRLERAFTGRRPGRSAPLSAAGDQALREQLEAWAGEVLAAGARPADVPDLFYLLRRMGTWAGPTHACVVPVHEPTSVLWSRRLVPHLLGQTPDERGREAPHRRLVELLAPELAGVPFGDGAGWAGPGRVARGLALGRRRARQATAEARRRLRPPTPAPTPAKPAPAPAAAPPADPFARPLAAIRAAAAAQPDHPAWAQVDRARVEALLAARPTDLDWMGRAYVWRIGTVFLPPG